MENLLLKIKCKRKSVMHILIVYHSVGKFCGGKFEELTLFEPLAKESLAN